MRPLTGLSGLIGRAAAAYQQIHPETSNLEAAVHALFESAQTGDNTSIKQVLTLTRDILNGQKSLRERTRQAAKDK